MLKWIATLVNLCFRDIYPIVSPRDNRRLSDPEFLIAQRISKEVLQAIQGRTQFASANGIAPKFAMPDAGWSYEAPNDFVNLFVRVSKAEKDVIENLRAFTQVFSGYSLYNICHGKGLSMSNLKLTESTWEQVNFNLRERGSRFVLKNLLMVKGLPERYVFKPPSMLGECGYSVNGRIVNSDTNGYQERINLIFKSGIGNYLDSLLRQRDEIKSWKSAGVMEHWLIGSSKRFQRSRTALSTYPNAFCFHDYI